MLLENFIDQKTCDEIADIYDATTPMFVGKTLSSQLLMRDHQITNDTTEAYSKVLQKIHYSLTDKVSGVFKKTLIPTRDYGRIYTKGAELHRHVDAGHCEYSVTINILNMPESGRWPFYVTDHKNITKKYVMNRGAAVLYYGPNWEHWRKPLPYDKCYQSFLHFVDINGTNAHYGNKNYKDFL